MASPALATAFVNIVPGTVELEKYLTKQLGNDVDSAGVMAGDKFAKGTATGFGGKIKGYFAPVVGTLAASFAALEVVGLFKGAVDEASNLNESLNAINVTFGSSASGIENLGKKAATAVGLSASEFNGLAVQFSAFASTVAGPGGDVVGVIDDLTKRGADFASVMNLDVNEAMGLFQSGLAGETEPLRKYGIDLSAAAVEAHALATGIWDGTGQMTEAQKVQARYSALMEQTSKTAGDFANTSDDLANKQRINAAEFKNAKAKLGESLLPVMTAAATFVNDTLIPAFQGFADAMVWASDNADIVIPILAGLAAAILYALAPAIWTAVTATWAWTTALLANPVLWVALAIGALVAGLVLLIMNFDKVTAFISDVWGKFVDWLSGTFESIKSWWSDLWDGLKTAVSEKWQAIRDWIETAVQGALDWFRDNWKNILAFLTGPIGLAIKWIVENWDTIKTFFSDSLDRIKTAFTTVFTGIKDFIKNTFSNIVGFVKTPLNAIIGLVNGAIKGINKLKIDIPDWVPGYGGKKFGFNLPTIPALANGGFVTKPTLALVGEAGPEVVTPLKEFERMIGTGGGKTINYYAAPNESLNSEEQLIRALRRAKVAAAW